MEIGKARRGQAKLWLQGIRSFFFSFFFFLFLFCFVVLCF